MNFGVRKKARLRKDLIRKYGKPQRKHLCSKYSEILSVLMGDQYDE